MLDAMLTFVTVWWWLEILWLTGLVFIVFDFFFFFSSRRRHTRCLSDWSSDVCSSDLEDIGSFRGQPLERAREVLHDHTFPLPEGGLGAVDPPTLGLAAENGVEDLVQERLPGVERHPGPRQLDRGRQELPPREVRVATVREGEPGRHPGHGDRRRADIENLLRALVEDDVDRPHLAAPGG